MATGFDDLKRTWEVLGEDDPLWAVASLDAKRGNRWDLGEFFATGEADVDKVVSLARRATGNPPQLTEVLDFGCGVGRLARAWSSRSGRVTALDVSSTMVARGKQLLADRSNIRWIVNHRTDLSCFEDASFDLISTLICLQHMPWEIASAYIHEFARVCRPGGMFVFQLPARPLISSRGASIRRRLVDSLPFGLGARYRRWRHGSAVVFDMHYTPRSVVGSVLSSAGFRVLCAEADESCASVMESYFYVAVKPG